MGYLDGDQDGYGAGSVQQYCVGDPDYTAVGGDCRDTDSNMRPGQTAVFPTPSCEPGWEACSVGVSNGCRPIGMTTCVFRLVDWDYDCDSTLRFEPPTLDCGGGSCGGTCSGSGPVYPDDPSSCGALEQNYTCGCPSGSCAPYPSGFSTRIFCR